MENSEQLDPFMPPPEARQVAGKRSRTTQWRWERDGLFPKPHKIGPNTNGYLRSEVILWQSMVKLRTWISNHGDREELPEPVSDWIEDLRFQMQLPKEVAAWLEERKTELPKDFLELLEEN